MKSWNKGSAIASQRGRSMVEILGVLVLVALLSAFTIYIIGYAIDYYKARQIVKGGQEGITIIDAWRRKADQNIEHLDTLVSEKVMGGYPRSYVEPYINATYSIRGGRAIQVSGFSTKVCEQVIKYDGTKALKRMTDGEPVLVNDKDIEDEPVCLEDDENVLTIILSAKTGDVEVEGACYFNHEKYANGDPIGACGKCSYGKAICDGAKCYDHDCEYCDKSSNFEEKNKPDGIEGSDACHVCQDGAEKEIANCCLDSFECTEGTCPVCGTDHTCSYGVDEGCGCGVAKVDGCCPGEVNEGCGCGVAKVGGCCPGEVNEGCGCGVAKVGGCCPGEVNEGCGCGVAKVGGCCPGQVNEGCGCGIAKVDGCCPGEVNEGCGCGIARKTITKCDGSTEECCENDPDCVDETECDYGGKLCHTQDDCGGSGSGYFCGYCAGTSQDWRCYGPANGKEGQGACVEITSSNSGEGGNYAWTTHAWDWSSSQNFCTAKGMRMISLSDLNCSYTNEEYIQNIFQGNPGYCCANKNRGINFSCWNDAASDVVLELRGLGVNYYHWLSDWVPGTGSNYQPFHVVPSTAGIMADNPGSCNITRALCIE